MSSGVYAKVLFREEAFLLDSFETIFSSGEEAVLTVLFLALFKSILGRASPMQIFAMFSLPSNVEKEIIAMTTNKNILCQLIL